MSRERMRGFFADNMAAQQTTLERCLPALMDAGEMLVECLRDGGKVLACGNGGSAGDAQHFASELVNRYQRDRPGLAAVALTANSATVTAIANDHGYQRAFARQVEALGRRGDVLLAISTSGQSVNVLAAIESAHESGLRVLALTGRDGGAMAPMLQGDDVELRAASEVTARIQEVHLLFIHCLCDYIDETLYPQG